MPTPESEANRLERLWRSEFGRAYSKRNWSAGRGRERFWRDLLAEYPVQSVLEVGCNVGGNLAWIDKHTHRARLCGIDVNEDALVELGRRLATAARVGASARQLPFRDEAFDLTFTTGVLIHQPPEMLPGVMREIVRCSGKYVLCGEYFSDSLQEIPYHGQPRALWKCDYGGRYKELFPNLRLLKQGFLDRDEGGWDDVTYWLFEKDVKT